MVGVLGRISGDFNVRKLDSFDKFPSGKSIPIKQPFSILLHLKFRREHTVIIKLLWVVAYSALVAIKIVDSR